MNEKAIETGGPAFPMADPFVAKQPKTSAEAQKLAEGMSLRDYFAAKAISAAWQDIGDDMPRNYALSAMACGAYEMADALLKARGDGA